MVWNACKGPEQIGLLKGTLYRLIEDQEQVATLGYVDTLDEQALLEELLEEVKPPFQQTSHDDLHYLVLVQKHN